MQRKLQLSSQIEPILTKKQQRSAH